MTPAERTNHLLGLYQQQVKIMRQIRFYEAQVAHEQEQMRLAKNAVAEAVNAGGNKRSTSRRALVALCGTEGGYYRHRRTLSEQPCDACKLAHRVAERGRQERREARSA